MLLTFLKINYVLCLLTKEMTFLSEYLKYEIVENVSTNLYGRLVFDI